MNLCSINDVRAELDRIEVQPNRRFGQNFLIDRNILDIILETAAIKDSDRILEVGPGLGVLTFPMAEKCRHLVCVEKDFRLTDRLRECFAGVSNVEIIGADIMRVDFSKIPINKCVSNLPYSCGSRFLVDMAACGNAETMVVMVQDEVAQKICSRPGSREFSLMGLFMQVDYDCELVKTVKPGCFWPRPEIDSCIVRMTLRKDGCLSGVEKIFLRKFAKLAFSQRRKTIGVLLRKRAGHDREAADAVAFLEGRRPEELSMDEWRHIAKSLCAR